MFNEQRIDALVKSYEAKILKLISLFEKKMRPWKCDYTKLKLHHFIVFLLLSQFWSTETNILIDLNEPAQKRFIQEL